MNHPGGKHATRRGARAARVLPCALLALAFVLASHAGHAQSGGILVSRNIFFAQAERPLRALAPGVTQSLGPERLEVGTPTRLRLLSRSQRVSAALRFRALPADPDGWELTVYLTTEQHDRDFYYLSHGQQAVGGKLVAQADYRANGLETELAAADEKGHPRRVRQIVIQDDGQAELRVTLDGDTLQVNAVTPEFGGTPSPSRFRGGNGPPLRFLDYDILAGGYTDNAFGELWLFGFLVLRGNYFTNSSETRGVGRVAFTQQAWRSEHFSVWLEGGAAVSQRRNEKTHVTQAAKVGLTAGVTGHWRYENFGASLHLGSAGDPLLVQMLAGWQFSKRWGAVLSWQQVKDSSGFGIGASMLW